MHRPLIHLMLMLALSCSVSACQLIYPIEASFDQGTRADAQMADLGQVQPRDASPDPPDVPHDMPADVPSDLVAMSPDMSHDMPHDMMRVQEMGPPFDPRVEPMRILFLGNSFTHQGPVPTFVQKLATWAGWPMPEVSYVAPGGKGLDFHRQSAESLQAVDRGGWHAVVLQDFSTRPTDNAGDPSAFKQDALWFFERVQTSSPNARVILYMTWARHPDHSIYPNTFSNDDEMQDQLAIHYRDAAELFIPERSKFPNAAELVTLAPVGEVWRHQLDSVDPLRLHGDDNYHANTHGRWLNALTLYATLYERRVTDLFIEELEVDAQQKLTASVDIVHPQDSSGGPDGAPFTPIDLPDSFDVGETILIDFGPIEGITQEPGWNNANRDTVRVANLLDSTNSPTGITLEMGSPFSGMNSAGLPGNMVGYPGTASADSVWSGDLGGTHEEALKVQGAIKLLGLDVGGAYQVKVFASRKDPDENLGRLGRYQIGELMQDLDVTDNVEVFVDFERIEPEPDGSFELTVNVSPDGTSRYAYLGVLEVTRLE